MDERVRIPAGYYTDEDCDLAAFAETVERVTPPAEVPNASEIQRGVPLYDMSDLAGMIADPGNRFELMAEWARVLKQGAGVIVLKNAVGELSVIDDATELYRGIIAREKASAPSGADHFAAAGNNDRIWNSLQKLCEADPAVFIRYFANPAIDAACECWLGPNYQMTAQINLVRPGGKAQQPHRDYHLGFQTAEVCARYPRHVHRLSPLMTLQGGIAHGDMPVESGPTKLLPFSQMYEPGYVAWRRDEFRAYFESRFVQLPLAKGDALFFNPALFHAAGENVSSDIERMVNLLQVSSAFGRAMESIDRAGMCAAVYEPLARQWQAGGLSQAELDAAIAAAGEGYSFPTNLDTDPPADGLAPRTQQALLREAILGAWSKDRFVEALSAQETRRRP